MDETGSLWYPMDNIKQLIDNLQISEFIF